MERNAEEAFLFQSVSFMVGSKNPVGHAEKGRHEQKRPKVLVKFAPSYPKYMRKSGLTWMIFLKIAFVDQSSHVLTLLNMLEYIKKLSF